MNLKQKLSKEELAICYKMYKANYNIRGILDYILDNNGVWNDVDEVDVFENYYKNYIWDDCISCTTYAHKTDINKILEDCECLFDEYKRFVKHAKSNDYKGKAYYYIAILIKEDILNVYYDMYKYFWRKRISKEIQQQTFARYQEMKEDYNSFEDYLQEFGYQREIYASKEEFKHIVFPEEFYIEDLTDRFRESILSSYTYDKIDDM